MNTPEPPAPAAPPIGVPATIAQVKPPAHCKNCGAVLSGRFCASCSQAADVHVPTTRELIHELMEGLTHSDSRLWRTLITLWFKPGRLTQEFIAGRRVAYLPPFRLYLIVSIVFFLIASFAHNHAQLAVIRFDDPSAPRTPQRITNCDDVNFLTFEQHPGWNQRIRHACEAIVRDNGNNWQHLAIGTMPKAMFLFLPLIAFLHMLLYWRPRHRYAEHLLFFVHVHAFYFSVAIILICASNAADAWPKLTGLESVLSTLLGWCLAIYTLLAMRRVFHRSWFNTLSKGVALFFVYMIVFGLTVSAVFVYAALQL
ncbi:MAG TPA: DUF3667 domain-containing protein [Steroidobacteraceae bacterium]